MRVQTFIASAATVAACLFPPPTAASESGYRQVIDGVAVYLGILPAELVRGHPPDHPEGSMHGGASVGENHVTVALFDARSGRRITDAQVTATITGPGPLRLEKKLESMVIADSLSYGNYFYMPGPGPYRVVLRFRLSGSPRGLSASFTWARS